MQTSMNALLALSWNTSASQGVLSGKFLEYLGADRPIVAVVAGEVPDSELSQVVQRLNVGICCEAAGGKSDRERLREWITSAVESRANSMPVTFEPNSDEVSQLEYGEISKQLVGISESLVQRD